MTNVRNIDFPDVLLPAQYFLRSGQPTPWQLLAAATLRQAVADYSNSAKQPRCRREIRSWIVNDSDRPRSFLSLCSMLELDPSYLRSHLLAVFNRIDRGGTVKVVRRSMGALGRNTRVSAN